MKPSAAAARGGRLDLGAARVAAAEADVLGHGAGQQHRILAHHRDLVAQAGERQRADVVAVDQDAPRRRVVEPRQQVEDRRLARARAADEGAAHAGLDGQRRRPRAPRGRRDRRSAPPRSGSGRARGRACPDRRRWCSRTSNSMKTRSSAAPPCCTAAKEVPSRRAGPATMPRPVRSPVKSAMVMVPAFIRSPTTKSRIATASPTSTSISGETRACQRFCLILQPEEPLEDRVGVLAPAAPPAGRRAPCGCPTAPR